MEHIHASLGLSLDKPPTKSHGNSKNGFGSNTTLLFLPFPSSFPRLIKLQTNPSPSNSHSTKIFSKIHAYFSFRSSTHKYNPRKTFWQPKPKTQTPFVFDFLIYNATWINEWKEYEKDSDLETVERCCRTLKSSPAAECSNTDNNITRKVAILIAISTFLDRFSSKICCFWIYSTT